MYDRGSLRTLAAAVVARWIARRHGVPAISPSALVERMTESPVPLLLDVRTTDEHQVSHLPDAVRVDPALEDLAPLIARIGSRQVVVYCAVGARSGALGARLASAGVPSVRNLGGGIFQWAREGRTLIGPGAPRVHPFGGAWQHLLPNDLRATPR